MEFKMEIDTRHTSRAFNALERRNYPFALANSLTQTAKDGQKAVRGRTKRIYELHGKHTLNQIKIKPAKKSMAKLGKAYSEVRTGKNAPYMPQHETGGKKLPRYEQYVAVPAGDMKKKKYRTKRGVKQMYHPEHLMQKSILAKRARSKGPRPSGKNRSKEKNVFIITSPKSNTPIMVRRKTMKRLPLEYLWVLVPKAKIKPTWKFYKTVDRRVSRTFHKHFSKAMRYALATSR